MIRPLFRPLSKLASLLEFVPPHQLIDSRLLVADLQQALLADPAKAQKHYLKIVGKQAHLLDGFAFASLMSLCANRDKLLAEIKSSIGAKLHRLSFKEIAQIVWTMAKLNQRDEPFFRMVELQVYQRPIPFDLPAIQKFLKGFTHFNCGSAMLYTKVCATLKKAQHQLLERDLLRFAYLVSKVRQNSSGATFLYHQLQQKMTGSVRRKTFIQSIQAAQVVLGQNICSNALQTSLEQRLSELMQKQIYQSQLVRLLKATAVYFFKYKNGCLLDKLQDRTCKMAPHLSPSATQYAVWAWSKSKRGGATLWRQLEKPALKYIRGFNDRSFSFTLAAMARSTFASDDFFKTAEEEVRRRGIAHMGHHYLLKVYSASQRLNQQLVKDVAKQLGLRIDKMTVVELARFIGLLAQSDLDFEDPFAKELNEILRQRQAVLLERLSDLSLEELGLLYFYLGKTNQSTGLRGRVRQVLEQNYLQIPKQVFLKVLFTAVVHDDTDLALVMIPILNELSQYGDLPYFFRPTEFVFLWYALLQFQVNAKTNTRQSLNVFPRQLLLGVKSLRPMLHLPLLDPFRLKVLAEADRLADQAFPKADITLPGK